MHTYYKIAIVIVLIFSALFFIHEQSYQVPTPQEGFFSSENSDLKNMTSTVGADIRSFNQSIYADPENDYSQKLGQYAIKSSYNTAYTGNFISLDAIKYVLSRGCRLLDFEVFLIDEKACVARTTEPNIYTSKNFILLDDVLNCVAVSGFNPSNCPNPTDPLFIQLRIQSKHEDLYELCAVAISRQLKKRLFQDAKSNILPVDKDTLIPDIMSKVVIMIDKKLAPDYDQAVCDPAEKNCYLLKNYVNIESGGDNVKSYTYPSIFDYAYTPYETEKHLATGIQRLKIIVPEVNTDKLSNPMALDIIVRYSMHMICCMFYNLDDSLKNYERVFAANGSAFLSLADAAQIMQKESAP